MAAPRPHDGARAPRTRGASVARPGMQCEECAPAEPPLAAGTRVRIGGLAARPELNGRFAIVVTKPTDTSRYGVLFYDERRICI